MKNGRVCRSSVFFIHFENITYSLSNIRVRIQMPKAV